MTTVKFIARILFYITRVLSAFYFAFALHAAFALSTGLSLTIREGGKYFAVNIPFTQQAYLLGDYNVPYILFDFLLPLAGYGLFFLLVSNIFKAFFQPRLFTKYGVTQLQRFYIANFILPGLALVLASFFTVVDDIAWVLVVLHFILAIFSYFMAAIFRQGLHLQTQQDLII
jgi:hypothetical protein